MTLNDLLPYLGLVCLVAALYSSVGHGGASGYIAVLSLTALAKESVSSLALTMNVFVAGAAFFAYAKKGHFRWGIVWPFLATSIPTSFLGGRIHIEDRVYFVLLGAVLTFAAVRLLLPKPTAEQATNVAPILPAIGAGAAIGLLSGVVGVGGGIFLSPLVMLLGWAGAKETAAASAIFILVNSLAGILGRATVGTYHVEHLAPILTAAVLGGLIGAWLGSAKLSPLAVQRTLAAVLIVAAFKLFIK